MNRNNNLHETASSFHTQPSSYALSEPLQIAKSNHCVNITLSALRKILYPPEMRRFECTYLPRKRSVIPLEQYSIVENQTIRDKIWVKIYTD